MMDPSVALWGQRTPSAQCVFSAKITSREQTAGNCEIHPLNLTRLMMDPSVDTTADEGIFSKRAATQTLMVGEYRRRLLRRLQLMRAAPAAPAAAANDAPALALAPAPAPAAAAAAAATPLTPAKRGASPAVLPTAAKKGPASVLVSFINSESAGKAPMTSMYDLLDVAGGGQV